jgi:23S rRNA (guanine2445-N2)-methyltransferase / 23S rRNA (guanine2069-N7)-methyltransferase
MSLDKAPKPDASLPYELIATAASGTEAIVKRELAELGYDAKTTTPGRLLFRGDGAAICRTNLWLRVAERILIRIGSFPAADFDALFEGTMALAWEEWLPRDAEFPVRGRSHRSQLSSVPACQRSVKRAIVERLLKAHRTERLPETGSLFSIEVSLRNDLATLTLDTTGIGLHKRGYRPLVGQAQLRETLAAAMVQLSFWRPGRVLADPFCGTGTIPIEAAMIGRNIAPGLRREFACEAWPTFDRGEWERAREEAVAAVLPALAERLLGYDIDAETLSLARYHAQQAGVADDIHWQQRPFSELRAKAEYGCIITNPPYGERMGDDREIVELYRSFPLVLRRLPTWSHYILSSRTDLEELVGQRATRRRKLYNGPIECTYYQFHGPRPPRDGAPPTVIDPSDAELEKHVHEGSDATERAVEGPLPIGSAKAPGCFPAFGGLQESAARQAEEFANRLSNRARHFRRWPTKRGITCYRLYERDVPDVPLIVDRYEDALHIAEFARPHDRSPAQHADWLDLMARTAAKALDVPRERVFLKFRDRQRGADQYQRVDGRAERMIAHEGGLKFIVNLSDYIDTGLFLDHRNTRQIIRERAAGKRFLNLFAYTGSFSVYAAAGNAESTTTVDKSSTYTDWASENMELNGFSGPPHTIVRNDIHSFLDSLRPAVQWDLAVVDPPTFSNTKGLEVDWDVQRDHASLLQQLAAHVTPGGMVYFSTNFRRFKLDEASLGDYAIRDITRQTVPEDFRNERIHKCWVLVRRGSGQAGEEDLAEAQRSRREGQKLDR